MRVPRPGRESTRSSPPTAARRFAIFVKPAPQHGRGVEADAVVLDREGHAPDLLPERDDRLASPGVLGRVLEALDAAVVDRRLDGLGPAR